MILLNALPAMSVRRLTPNEGAWLADVDVELDASGIPPKGPCIVTIDNTPLVGTIDPDASGFYGTHFRARVIAGAGGWQKKVPKQAFHNDGGVLSSVPIMATGALVGERAIVAAPTPVGTDFTRYGDLPAYQVFRGLDWHVDAAGITQVAPRIPVPLIDPTVVVASFDPLLQTVDLRTDKIIEPGMVLVNPLFGTAIIRQVEQTWDTAGGRATAWVSSSDDVTHSLGASLAKLARIAVGLPTLRSWQYRVVAQSGDGRLVLQAVNIGGGIPDQLPISIMYGVPGCSAKVTPGTIVLVQFPEGNSSLVKVLAFDSTVPLEVDVEATATANVTAALINLKAPLVSIGEAPQSGVATLQTMAPLMVALEALVTAVNLLIGTPNATALAGTAPPIDPTGSLSSAVTAACSTLTGLLPAPTNFSATVAAAP